MGDYKGVWIGTFIFFLALILVSPLIYAQETYNIVLSMNTVNIDGFNSKFLIYDFNSQNITSGSQVIRANNLMTLTLNEGFYEVSIGVDNPATPGFDYYGKVSISADSDKRVEVDAVPVGSRKIEIIDKKGIRLNDAPLRIDCNSLSGEQGYFRTDDFGIAEANFLPIGECVFRAAAGDFVISQNDTIEKGSASEIIMKFDDYSRNSGNVILVVVSLAILVIVAIIIYMIFYGKRLKKNYELAEQYERRPVQEMNDEKQNTIDVKKDIMTALNPNERKVVSFILEAQDEYESKNGTTKGFYLHQAKIVYGAGIPKTTLVRLFQSLEQKKIIKWEKSGKIKKVRLTEWFNSK